MSSVLIIGGGLAGITAALELLDQNAHVTILDRDVESQLGGLAQWSLGGIFLVDSPIQRKRGIKDSEALAKHDWWACAEFEEEAIWPKKWAEAYISNCTSQVYEWLRPKGIGFIPFVNWLERGMHTPGSSVPRFHVVWGAGRVLSDTLVKELRNHPNGKNLTMHFGHKVEELVLTNGQVTGAKGVKEGTGEAFEYTAEQVIIASGGITGNDKFLKAHWYKPWGTPPETILNGAHKYGDATVHLAAQKAGANLTHLDKVWNYAAGVHYPGGEAPYEGLSLIPPKSGLWLNYQGERIGPAPLVTGFDTRFLVQEICKQEKKYSWQLINMKIASRELLISGSEYSDAIRERKTLKFITSLLFGNKQLTHKLIDTCPDFVVGNSLEELVPKMNALTGTDDVRLDTVRAAANYYDRQVAVGKKYQNDEQFRRIAQLRNYLGDRLRTVKNQALLDPGAGPLIAIREFILARKSLGGIQTDLSCRVLDLHGQPIPGLYAIGEAAGFGGGGIHGLRTMEGTFLGNAIFTGRRVAMELKS